MATEPPTYTPVFLSDFQEKRVIGEDMDVMLHAHPFRWRNDIVFGEAEQEGCDKWEERK